MTDLVVVSLERWDGVWRRNQHLLSRMLQADRSLRVLFVEPAADPLHALRSGRRPNLGHGPTDVTQPGRLWTMRPLKALPRRIDRRSDARIAARIARAAGSLGMDEPVLWVNDPGGAELSRLTGWRTLYDMTDDWLAAQRPEAELARVAAQEAYLIAHAIQVVACSPELQRRKSAQRPAGPEPIQLVRNAVDSDAYRLPRARPADLPDGRTAVYVGTLHADRLDVDVCVSVAERLGASGSLVLVGPDALPCDVGRRLHSGRRRDAGSARARRGDRVSAACRRPGRSPRGDAVHRQSRPDQALRVPGGRSPRCIDRCGRLPRRRGRPHRDRRSGGLPGCGRGGAGPVGLRNAHQPDDRARLAPTLGSDAWHRSSHGRLGPVRHRPRSVRAGRERGRCYGRSGRAETGSQVSIGSSTLSHSGGACTVATGCREAVDLVGDFE